ncbi:hypothetical protein [Pseudohalioglobus lutimaris]|uniref:Uncharacterized protein n=1 Tax=Pseudohalioglobus lutimaris TaxID=1737061 RepID=A0A2N5X1E8_9GAMM|nr:hypothetical protein [Pseudohalioglobus lutimaris]PLW68319.1 hypothetical protein C0039_13060 [Pseudohalioglobus lutimaris]
MAGLTKRLGLMAVLACLPLAAQAMMTEEQAAQAVEDMLAEGSSAQQVVAALLADGRDAQSSAVLALSASAADFHRELGVAGVCAAANDTEALQVAAALGALPGIDEDDLERIMRTADTWATGGCASPILTEPPGTYDSSQLPGGGGGVSPAS